MSANTQWGLVIGAVGGLAYYAATRPKPYQMSAEEAEYLAPAPFSTEGGARDNLTPSDYQTESRPVLAMPYAQYLGGFFPQMPPYTKPPSRGQNPGPDLDWNTPGRPQGRPDEGLRGLKGPEPLRLGSANIRHGHKPMSDAKVTADVRKMAGLCDIFGMQEIHGRYPGIVNRALGPGWNIVLENWETPFAFRTKYWEVIDTRVSPFERKGIKRVNQHSAVTSIALRNKRRPQIEIAVVNFHLINGAYNLPARNQFKKRIPIWHREMGQVRDVILYHRRQGRTVFYMGDTNNPFAPVPIKPGRWLSNTGIDKIGIAPHRHGAHIARVVGSPNGARIRLNSDHSGRVINLRLK